MCHQEEWLISFSHDNRRLYCLKCVRHTRMQFPLSTMEQSTAKHTGRQRCFMKDTLCTTPDAQLLKKEERTKKEEKKKKRETRRKRSKKQEQRRNKKQEGAPGNPYSESEARKHRTTCHSSRND